MPLCIFASWHPKQPSTYQRQNITPMSEVGMNVVTVGYVRSTAPPPRYEPFHPPFRRSTNFLKTNKSFIKYANNTSINPNLFILNSLSSQKRQFLPHKNLCIKNSISCITHTRDNIPFFIQVIINCCCYYFNIRIMLLNIFNTLRSSNYTNNFDVINWNSLICI